MARIEAGEVVAAARIHGEEGRVKARIRAAHGCSANARQPRYFHRFWLRPAWRAGILAAALDEQFRFEHRERPVDGRRLGGRRSALDRR